MTTDDVVAVREDIPLKTGRKSNDWYSFTEDCLGGSKFINVAFGTLTLVITIALLVQIYYGDYQVVPHGSVATDSLQCSKIGTTILKRGGNAADAAIASTFCLAAVTPHLTSLDGEGQLLLYNHRTRLAPSVIDFSQSGSAAERLPRLVLGLAYVHQQYGTFPWSELVRPAAELAKQGFLIPKMLVQAVAEAKAEDLYGRLEAGQMLQLETLADTLQKIANISENELYKYLEESSQITHSQALRTAFYNYDIYVPNSPSIGPFLLMNLQQIEKFNFTAKSATRPDYVFRLAKITQIVYEDLNLTTRFHQGTSTNVAVIDLNDNYVSLVTGLYSLFGSGEMTSAGYVLDVKPRSKRCTRIPVIITDNEAICGRRIIFGANDITIATQLITSLLIGQENATESVESARFHMLTNGSIGIEASHTPLFTEEVLKYLETLTSSPLLVSEPYFSSNIVEKLQDGLSSHSDSRGGGIASRF